MRPTADATIANLTTPAVKRRMLILASFMSPVPVDLAPSDADLAVEKKAEGPSVRIPRSIVDPAGINDPTEFARIGSDSDPSPERVPHVVIVR